VIVVSAGEERKRPVVVDEGWEAACRIGIEYASGERV
jgi:hypothetical protein